MAGKKNKLKKILWVFLYATALLFLFLVLIEASYRNYWFDYYAAENDFLNVEKYTPRKKTILVFGDSFTAGGKYIEMLRDSLPAYNIINAGLPGTGIREASVTAESRISQYSPDLIIFQVYAGNDFTDMYHNLNFNTLSISRNLYWWLSDQMLSLRYINYKLGQFKGKADVKSKSDTIFDEQKYSARQKVLFSSDPGYLSNALMMQEPEKKKVEDWFAFFDAIRAYAADSVKICILLIPHCAQVEDRYIHRMEILGAAAFDDGETLNPNCPMNQYFSTECSKRRVKLLNAQPQFQNADSLGNTLYFENDFHLSHSGDSVLNSFLLKKLKNLKF